MSPSRDRVLPTPDDPALYRAQIETSFVVTDGATSVQLRLAAVSDERIAGTIQQFSLFFHGPSDRILSQGTYRLDHEILGSLALFLVPVIGSNSERIVYEACFTKLVVSSAMPPR